MKIKLRLFGKAEFDAGIDPTTLEGRLKCPVMHTFTSIKKYKEVYWDDRHRSSIKCLTGFTPRRTDPSSIGILGDMVNKDGDVLFSDL